MAKVDVIIPVYNAQATVEESIGSIQRQSLKDLRIIVVNDGSTDASLHLIQKIAEQDPRIAVLDVPNGGIVDALNLGLACSQSPVIARHDADDIAFPDRLQTQLTYLHDHADCVAVGSNARHIDVNGILTGTVSAFTNTDDADEWAFPSREPYIIHPFLMARRSAVEAVGGYRHAHHAEDTDLYRRLSAQGRLHNLSDVHGLYRMHGESVTNKSVQNGRIGALNSQLAAVSQQRRKAGREDLKFNKSALSDQQAANSLEAMLGSVKNLSDLERRYVGAAATAKLMSATLFRPYELELADCRFARRALAQAPANSELQRREIDWFIATTGRRLLSKNKSAEFFALVPPRLFPRIAAQILRAALNDRRGVEQPPSSRSSHSASAAAP